MKNTPVNKLKTFGNFKDYTDKIITTKKNKEVHILSLVEKVKYKDSVWSYNCPYCGTLTKSTINHIKRGDGCDNCRYIRYNKARMKTNDDFKKELFESQPTVELIDTYKGHHNKLDLLCKIHNHRFSGVPANILKSNNSCPLCIIEINRLAIPLALADG